MQIKSETKFKVMIKSMAMSCGGIAKISYSDKLGKSHVREVTAEKKEKESLQKLELAAIAEALKILKPGCEITLDTMQAQIVTSLKLGWVEKWKKHDWTNAKGEPLANKEEWQQVLNLLGQHKLNFK